MANIIVWVLTSDKQETTISIGYSSKLLTSKMTQFVIDNKSTKSCRRSLEDALNMSRKSVTSGDKATSLALIIDGTSLVYILDTELEQNTFGVVDFNVNESLFTTKILNAKLASVVYLRSAQSAARR